MSKKLYHPHSDITVEVEDSEVDAWAEQGWRKTDPNKTSAKSGEDK